MLNALMLLLLLLFAAAPLLNGFGIPFGPVLAVAALASLANILITPGRRYRAWGYRLDTHELHLQSGVWTRVNTIVPLARVQHIDVSQDPLERRHELGRLIVHTAGTRSSDVELPGLPYATAEALRDTIRAHIRHEAP